MPTNDVANDYPFEEIKANYEELVERTTLHDFPVWVTTSQPRNNLYDQQYENLIQFRDWTYTRFGEKAVDFWTTVANPDGTIVASYNSDNIHLNNAGHEIL